MKKRKSNRQIISMLLTVLLISQVFSGPILEANAAVKKGASAKGAEDNLGFENELDGWETAGDVSVEPSGQEGSKSVLLEKNATIRTTLTDIAQGSYSVTLWVRGAASGNTANMTISETGGPDSDLLIDKHLSSSAAEWSQIGHRNVLVYNGQMTIEIGSGNSTGLYIDAIEVTLDSEDENTIKNWDFENGLTDWEASGTAGIDSSEADTKTNSVKLSAGDEISQEISVEPNTIYALTMRAKVDNQDTFVTKEHHNWIGKIGETVDRTSLGNRVNLGVKTKGGKVLRQAPAGTEDYALVSVTFKTGPSDTSVIVYANTKYDDNYKDSITVYIDGEPSLADDWQGNGDDFAYVDNFDLFSMNDEHYIKGADVSFLPAIEDSEGKYFANGVQQDCLRILSNHGVNSVLTMIFVHAGNPIYGPDLKKQYIEFLNEEGTDYLEYRMIDEYFDKEHSTMIGRRATELGMSYMPSFHYSDAWISNAKANIPYEWLNQDYDGNLSLSDIEHMQTAVYNYVYDSLNTMKEENINLAGVKHGNEQNGGLLFPIGSGSTSVNHTKLVEASRKAAEEVVPGISAYIHTNNGYDTGAAEKFFKGHLNNGAAIDGAAFSLYGGRNSDNILYMANALNASADLRYLDYVNVETAFTFTGYKATFDTQSSSMLITDYYRRSPNGQYNWLLDYMQAALDVANPYGQTRGFYYWETDWIPAPGAATCVGQAANCNSRIMFNNGDTGIKEMGSSQPGKAGDMMDSMYANLMRTVTKNKAETVKTPIASTYEVDTTKPESITLANATLNLTEGEVERLKPTIKPVNKVLTDSNITFSSTDDSVAKVSHDGFVTAVSAGATTVTATDSEGHVATATVNVAAAKNASAVTVKMDNTAVVGGQTVTRSVLERAHLTAEMDSDVSKQSVIFTSSNPEVASFLGETWQTPEGEMRYQTNKGTKVQLNTKQAGTTTITAETADGGASVSFELVVGKIDVQGITLDKTDEKISYNRTIQLKATVSPADTSFYRVHWESEDTSIAAVDSNGLVRGTGVGTTTIKAVSDDDPDVFAECSLEVLEVQAESVLLDRAKTAILPGGTKTLTAQVMPEDTVDKSLTWSSSDEGIVSVNQNGEITGVSVGEAKVIATTNNGGHTAECIVTVQDEEVVISEISLNADEYYFKSDYFAETILDEIIPTYRFEAAVGPENATDDKVFWSSDNPSVATVDGMGIVTPVSSGVARIIAASKEGDVEAYANVYVPKLSDSFENREVDDTWGTKVGTASGSNGSAKMDSAVIEDSTGKYLQFSSSGNGGRSQQKVFPNVVSNDKIILDFDVNLGTVASTYYGYVTIKDSDANRYLSIQKTTEGLSFNSGGKPETSSLLNTTSLDEKFNGDHWYNLFIILDMKEEKAKFTISLKDDPAVTETYEIDFDANTQYKGDLESIEFVGVRVSAMNFRPALDNFNIYVGTAEAQDVVLNTQAVRLIPVKNTLMTKYQMSAEIIPVSAPQEFIWESSDTNVATVDESGLVKSAKLYDSLEEIEETTCTIRATAKGNKDIYAEAQVNVTKTLNAVETFIITDENGNIVFNQGDEVQEIGLSTGDKKQLKPEIAGGDGPSDIATILWETSNKALVDIDSESGALQALRPGSTTVKLTAVTYGGETYTGQVKFQVIGKMILETKGLEQAIKDAIAAKTEADNYYTEESLSEYKAVLANAQTMLETAKQENWDYTEQYVIDECVEALYTAAQKLEKENTIAIEEISISGDEKPVSVNRRTALQADIAPAYATEGITWSSSDEDIATVSHGIVTGKSAGDVTIVAESPSGVRAEKEVTITSDLTSWYEDNGVTFSTVGMSTAKPTYGVENPFINARTLGTGGTLDLPNVWSTNSSTAHGSITINLGTKAELDNIFVAFWEVMKYTVEVSDDGENWTMAIDYSQEFPDMEFSTANTMTEEFPQDTKSQYIRLTTVELLNKTKWVGITAIQVNGTFAEDNTKELYAIEVSAPDKTVYSVGEELDLTGLGITAIYSDGSDEERFADDCVITGYNKDQAGEQTINVSYEDGDITKTATFTVTVSTDEKEFTSIRIIRPEKIVYGLEEDLDLEGLIVKAVYSNGDVKEIDEGDYQVSGFTKGQIGIQTITVSYKEGDITKEAEFIVVVKGLEFIKAAGPNKTSYRKGEDLDLSGLVVKAAYSDGEEVEIASADYKVSGYDKNKPGNQSVTVSYTENNITKTTSFTVTVEAELASIQVTGPNKIIYKQGEDLDLSGLVVKAIYDDGEEAELVSDDYEISGYDKNKLGKQTITVSYTEGDITKTSAFTVTVNVVLTSLKITGPSKTIYKQGEELNLSGLVVKAVYSDEEEAELTSDDYKVSGYDKDKLGEQVITVSYTEDGITKTATFTVAVRATLASIQITEPDKTIYKQGEELDLSGLVVKAFYSDEEEVKLTSADYEVSGYDKNKTGKQVITISYTEGGITKTATFTVTVDVTLASLKVTGPEKTTYKQGEELDLTGLVVKAVYSDGEEAELTSDDYEVSGYDKNKTGKQAITISYTEDDVTKTGSFTVTVKAELTSIEVAEPGKTIYAQGEELDLSGLVVKAVYSDGEETELTSDDYEVSGYDKNKAGKQVITISYTEDEITKTATFTVTVTVKEQEKVNVSKLTIGNIADQYYTGKDMKPALNVQDGNKKLSTNTDYTLVYKNNKSVGKATITLTGKGNYTGTRNVTFRILPKETIVKTKSQTKSAITLTWSKPVGAQGYDVYRSTSKNSGYKKVKTITNAGTLTYKDTKLKKGTFYYYKVVPYAKIDGSNVAGKESAILTSGTKTAAPSIKVKPGKKKATVSWKKVTGADGYEVYRATSKKGKYRKAKTLSGAKKVKFTNNKLKSKKTYYYKVRTYKKINGKKVYSTWSKVKPAKVK